MLQRLTLYTDFNLAPEAMESKRAPCYKILWGYFKSYFLGNSCTAGNFTFSLPHRVTDHLNRDEAHDGGFQHAATPVTGVATRRPAVLAQRLQPSPAVPESEHRSWDYPKKPIFGAVSISSATSPSTTAHHSLGNSPTKHPVMAKGFPSQAGCSAPKLGAAESWGCPTCNKRQSHRNWAFLTKMQGRPNSLWLFLPVKSLPLPLRFPLVYKDTLTVRSKPGRFIFKPAGILLQITCCK